MVSVSASWSRRPDGGALQDRRDRCRSHERAAAPAVGQHPAQQPQQQRVVDEHVDGLLSRGRHLHGDRVVGEGGERPVQQHLGVREGVVTAGVRGARGQDGGQAVAGALHGQEPRIRAGNLGGVEQHRPHVVGALAHHLERDPGRRAVGDDVPLLDPQGRTQVLGVCRHRGEVVGGEVDPVRGEALVAGGDRVEEGGARLLVVGGAWPAWSPGSRPPRDTRGSARSGRRRGCPSGSPHAPRVGRAGRCRRSWAGWRGPCPPRTSGRRAAPRAARCAPRRGVRRCPAAARSSGTVRKPQVTSPTTTDATSAGQSVSAKSAGEAEVAAAVGRRVVGGRVGGAGAESDGQGQCGRCRSHDASLVKALVA